MQIDHDLIVNTSEHVATIELYKIEGGFIKGWCKIGQGEGTWIDVPEMYAAQLPQAFAMMQALQNSAE
jgi:hypothetical protein